MRATIRLLLCVVLLSPFVAAAPVNAQPRTLSIHLRLVNDSQTCAWVTVYLSKTYLPWQKMYYGWIHKGSTNRYLVTIPQYEPMKYPSELKVRAEFKKNADCTGPTVADYHEQRKDIYGDKMGGFLANVHQKLSGPPWSVQPILIGE